MPLSRRSFLFGSAAFACGLSTASCGNAGSPDVHAASPSRIAVFPSSGVPSGQEVIGALRDLVKEAGRDAFQSVEVSTDRRFDRTMHAGLLNADGGVDEFTYDHDWKWDGYEKKDDLTSPESVRIDELPLDRLPAYVNATRGEARSITFAVDYVGEIQVNAFVNTDEVGLKLDGTGTVPVLKPDKVAEVESTVGEMVAVYGHRAERVGSFNGFVHMDANVSGCHAAVRIVRNPQQAAEAHVIGGTPFNASRLFDPSDFDPAMAVTRKAGIAKEAGVKGEGGPQPVTLIGTRH